MQNAFYIDFLLNLIKSFETTHFSQESWQKNTKETYKHVPEWDPSDHREEGQTTGPPALHLRVGETQSW